MNAFEDLKWRGAIYDATPGSEKLFDTEKITVYFDLEARASAPLPDDMRGHMSSFIVASED